MCSTLLPLGGTCKPARLKSIYKSPVVRPEPLKLSYNKRKKVFKITILTAMCCMPCFTFLNIFGVCNFFFNYLISFCIGVQELLPDCQPSPMTDSGLSCSSTSSSISLGVGSTAMSHLSPTLISEVDVTVEQDRKAKALIEFITSRLAGSLYTASKLTYSRKYQ